MFDALISDINGVWRGLQLPPPDVEDAIKNGLSMPRSLYALRLDGGVVEETGIGLATGDPDYPCVFLPQTRAKTAWRKDGEQAVMTMQLPDGKPFYASPQAVLAAVSDKLTADNMTPVLAAEFEFYLDGEDNSANDSELYSPDKMARNDDFFNLLRRAAAEQNINLGAAISEYAPGQFEVNLRHGNAEEACLQALLFRRLVRSCARAVGRRATFMAKPRGELSGSGMHVHLSLQDGRGGFCFTDEKMLMSAVAGALAVMREAFLFFAPFGNSYRRFVPGSYVPLSACWAKEDRRAAVRIPLADSPGAVRLELRTPGADANPCLVAAALMAGVHWGIVNRLTPPKSMATSRVPATWHAAMDTFARAKILPQYIDKRFLRLYHQIKTSEMRREIARISEEERDDYRRVL